MVLILGPETRRYQQGIPAQKHGPSSYPPPSSSHGFLFLFLFRRQDPPSAHGDDGGSVLLPREAPEEAVGR